MEKVGGVLRDVRPTVRTSLVIAMIDTTVNQSGLKLGLYSNAYEIELGYM
jgi:hypothetical protein